MTGVITRTQAERLAAGNNGKNHTAAALTAAVWMAQNGYCAEEIRRYIQRRYLSQGRLCDSAMAAFGAFFTAESYAEAILTAQPYGTEAAAAAELLARAYFDPAEETAGE